MYILTCDVKEIVRFALSAQAEVEDISAQLAEVLGIITNPTADREETFEALRKTWLAIVAYQRAINKHTDTVNHAFVRGISPYLNGAYDHICAAIKDLEEHNILPINIRHHITASQTKLNLLFEALSNQAVDSVATERKSEGHKVLLSEAIVDGFGTVVEGSLRLRDLVPVFADFLKQVVEMAYGEKITLDKYAQYPHQATRAVSLIGRAYEFHRLACPESLLDYEDILHEQASELLDSLADAINEYIPDGWYFGAHEGDGSDFGIWPAPTDSE